MKTSFELFNGVLGFTVLIHETRIHTNQNESRAYSRLLFPLIAENRGTLAPSQSARAFFLILFLHPFVRADCEVDSDRTAVPR